MLKLFDLKMNEIEKIIEDYKIELFPLDNFSPYGLVMDGLLFQTSEHAFQYLKFVNCNPTVAKKILNAPTPGGARAIAHYFKKERDPDWNNIKYLKMEEVIRQKVLQNDFVKEALINTGDYIICESCIDEDTDWGIDRNNQGENNLGKILMSIREELKPVKVEVISIFKDSEEEKKFSEICKNINYGLESKYELKKIKKNNK